MTSLWEGGEKIKTLRMFGNTKKETGKSSNFISNGPTNSLNSIVSGTTIEGTVNSESDIRVDGTIKGKLFCQAKAIIGPTGRIEGEIYCKNAVIEGQFEGTLEVKELLTLKESAVVSGDVTTNKLIINSGAVFNVNCSMDGNKPTKTKATSNGQSKVSTQTSQNSSATKASSIG